MIYLPKIYEIINDKCNQLKNVSMESIFNECNKYLAYVKMNLNIKNFHKMSIPINATIQGLIKYEYI